MPAPGGRPAVPAPVGRPAAQRKGGRPAAKAAAAPPRSRLRREIRGDERCSLMAGGTPHDRTGRTLACPRRVLAAETASAVPADPGLALVLPCAAGMSASGDAVQTAVST